MGLSEGNRSQEDGPKNIDLDAGKNYDAGETFKKLLHN